MAGDWIKVEKVTPDKPELAILARKLGCSLGDAFVNWFRVYAWADGITESGCVPHLSLDDGDTLSRSCPGTCAALASKEIAWLTISKRGISFGHWDRHNGKSAKSRGLEAERKRNQRKNRPDEPGTKHGTKPGPEKRREEKSIKEEANASSSRTVPSEEDFELATEMFSKIAEIAPKAMGMKPPQQPVTIHRWANEIRLMREQDDRASPEIRKVFEWANRDSFWRSNILSAGKLREKFDQLKLRMADRGGAKQDNSRIGTASGERGL